MDRNEYCREIEAYLCRKNDGHLIRVVGPSFELVSGWADRGIPINVACRGIDRHFERYYAKGPRRRPVRIDFCEADVLDAFDEWRRAVGLRSADPAGEPAPRRPSLAQHVERTMARLTAARAGAPAPLDEAIERIVRVLDRGRAGSKALRGQARAVFLSELDELDRDLMDAARQSIGTAAAARIDRDVADQLAAFRSRMSDAAYEQARSAARDRLVRAQLGLPMLTP